MVLLVLQILHFFFETFVFFLDTSELFVAHSFLLVELLIEALVLGRGIFFERPPLVLQLLHLLLQAFFVHAISFLLLNCI